MTTRVAALLTSASLIAGGLGSAAIAHAQSRPPGTVSCFGPWTDKEQSHDTWAYPAGHVGLHVTYRYNLPCGWFILDSVTPECSVDLGTCGEHSQGIIGRNPGDDITAWYDQQVDHGPIGSDHYHCRIFLRGSSWNLADVSGWCN